MKVYYRNTNIKFIFLWSIAILLILGLILTAIAGNILISFVLLCFLLISGFIRVHGVSISSDYISIRRYYFYGFRNQTISIPQNKFHTIELWEHGKIDSTGSTNTWLDIIFIPALFLDGKKGLTYKILDSEMKMKSFVLYINNQEYHLLSEILH